MATFNEKGLISRKIISNKDLYPGGNYTCYPGF